jgi:hypothetical protein
MGEVGESVRLMQRQKISLRPILTQPCQKSMTGNVPHLGKY